ncbi:hypothetical protein C0995_008571 [Termitomyces sp. Mi166|nr:hypothetical protein C0995_008571 [Termitomyces sp. Mi166\
METVRKQAPRLPRPAARYWKGKAPKGAVEIDSESEDEDVRSMEEEGDVAVGGDQDFAAEDEDEDLPMRADVKMTAKSMNVALKDVNISKDGKVIVAGREESGRTALEEEESEEEEEEEEEKPHILSNATKAESQESSEYETDSEEEEEPQLKFRPVFVPKRARATIAERDALLESEESEKRRELEAEERRKQSHDMVAESIKRELAEKEKEEDVNDVDDTDGLDPAAEFEAWRLRELGRIKKEKEEEVRREEDREEVERRRALPEEQRMKEDVERANKLREEKPKGQQKFLQKYWHKGAFHQDEEILKKHDYTAPTESTVDISMLPKVMQVKNFGKRSRTKYTHLAGILLIAERVSHVADLILKRTAHKISDHLQNEASQGQISFLMALVSGEILRKRGHGAEMTMFLGAIQDGREIKTKSTVDETIAIGITVTKARATDDAQGQGTMKSVVRDEDLVQLPALAHLIGNENMQDEREDIHQNDRLININDDVSTKVVEFRGFVVVNIL